MSTDILGPDGTPASTYVAKGIPVASGTGDGTIAGMFATGNRAAVRDLDLYWMLVTKHPTVTSCVTLVADAVASEGFDIAPADDEEGKPLSIKDDPRLSDIRSFMRFGSTQGTARAERRSQAIDILAFGYTLVRLKRNGKTLVGRERLDPRTVQAVLNPKRTAIEKYLVRPISANGLASAVTVETIDAKDVILIATAGGDPVTGFASPLESLDLTAATDNAARLFRRAAFDNAAFLGTVLANKTAQKDQVDALIAQLRAKKEGAANALSTLVAAGDWTLLSAAKAGQNDGDFINATALSREDICGVYKVPVGMLTFAKGALGSAGKGDDRDFFEQFAVLPVEETIYEALTLRLLRDEWGIEDLELVPKRRNRVRLERFAAAEQMTKFGATANQALEFAGLPRSAYQGMDIPLFLGVTNAGGLGADEPPDPSAPLDSTDAGASADGADAAREVAQKGSDPFRTRLTLTPKRH